MSTWLLKRYLLCARDGGAAGTAGRAKADAAAGRFKSLCFLARRSDAERVWLEPTRGCSLAKSFTGAAVCHGVQVRSAFPHRSCPGDVEMCCGKMPGEANICIVKGEKVL